MTLLNIHFESEYTVLFSPCRNYFCTLKPAALEEARIHSIRSECSVGPSILFLGDM